MLEIVLGNQFKRDLKLAVKRGYDLSLLESVVERLAGGETLPAHNRDHALTGKYSGFRECHILPDWLLVYRAEEELSVLFLTRTGRTPLCFEGAKTPRSLAVSPVRV